ncbi:hypothetical protein Tco_1520943, partial [Tanacetum coccineum]
MSSSTVTNTSISSDLDLPPWGFQLLSDAEPQSPEVAPQSPEQAPPSPDYVPGPEYPEYVASSDDEIPVEDQPLPADASPTALSPGYVVDTDLEEHPEDDLKESSKDDDEEEESFEYDDDDEEEASEEEEEHLAPTDSAILPAIDPVPLAEETEPFETNESTATPPPPPTRSPRLRSFFLRHVSVGHKRLSDTSHLWQHLLRHSLVSLLLHPHLHHHHHLHYYHYHLHSPRYHLHPYHYHHHLPNRFILALPMLVHHWATDQPWFSLELHHHPLLSSELPPPPFLLPYTAHRDDIPEADMPLWKRARFTAPTHRFRVGESSATAVARQIGNALTSSVDHGFINTVDAKRGGNFAPWRLLMSKRLLMPERHGLSPRVGAMSWRHPIIAEGYRFRELARTRDAGHQDGLANDGSS